MFAQCGIAVARDIQKNNLMPIPFCFVAVFFPHFAHLGALSENVLLHTIFYAAVNILIYPIPYFLRNLVGIFRQVRRSVQQPVRQRIFLVICLGFECFYVYAFQNICYCLLVQLYCIGKCFENTGAIFIRGKTDVIAAVIAGNAQDSRHVADESEKLHGYVVLAEQIGEFPKGQFLLCARQCCQHFGQTGEDRVAVFLRAQIVKIVLEEIGMFSECSDVLHLTGFDERADNTHFQEASLSWFINDGLDIRFQLVISLAFLSVLRKYFAIEIACERFKIVLFITRISAFTVGVNIGTDGFNLSVFVFEQLFVLLFFVR